MNKMKELVLQDGRTALLRQAEEMDAEQLLALARQTTSETPYLGSEPDEYDFSIQQEREWIRQQNSGSSLLLVAEIDGRLVGDCSIHPQGLRRRTRHRCGLGISLLQEVWGNGLGTAMLEYAIFAAKNFDYEQMELEVVSTNERAINLYRKLGFVPCGLLPRALKYKDGSWGDFTQMVLDLRTIERKTEK